MLLPTPTVTRAGILEHQSRCLDLDGVGAGTQHRGTEAAVFAGGQDPHRGEVRVANDDLRAGHRISLRIAQLFR